MKVCLEGLGAQIKKHLARDKTGLGYMVDAMIAHINAMESALTDIAALGDSGHPLFKETFDPDELNGIPTGWRVAEKMRERALDVIGEQR